MSTCIMYDLSKNTKLDESEISICNIMKDKTSEIVKKIECHIPLAVQQYSNLYTAYLHSFDDMFGMCYVSQKEFFDKLNISQETLREFEKYLDLISKSYQDWIDLRAKYWQDYVQMRLSMIKSYDQFVHITMESYAKTLAKFNEMCDSTHNEQKKL